MTRETHSAVSLHPPWPGRRRRRRRERRDRQVVSQSGLWSQDRTANTRIAVAAVALEARSARAGAQSGRTARRGLRRRCRGRPLRNLPTLRTGFEERAHDISAVWTWLGELTMEQLW